MINNLSPMERLVSRTAMVPAIVTSSKGSPISTNTKKVIGLKTIKTKRCFKCDDIKSLSEFYRKKDLSKSDRWHDKDGYNYWCKNCIRERQKIYQKEQRIMVNKYKELIANELYT